MIEPVGHFCLRVWSIVGHEYKAEMVKLTESFLVIRFTLICTASMPMVTSSQVALSMASVSSMGTSGGTLIGSVAWNVVRLPPSRPFLLILLSHTRMLGTGAETDSDWRIGVNWMTVPPRFVFRRVVLFGGKRKGPARFDIKFKKKTSKIQLERDQAL